MEVSVLGDAVNLASRLESATKEYGLDLCLGESVAPLVREAFILRSVDLILAKGKTQPVEVFTARTPGTAIFFARCAALRENPPPGQWTGIFTMPGKQSAASAAAFCSAAVHPKHYPQILITGKPRWAAAGEGKVCTGTNSIFCILSADAYTSRLLS